MCADDETHALSAASFLGLRRQPSTAKACLPSARRQGEKKNFNGTNSHTSERLLHHPALASWPPRPSSRSSSLSSPWLPSSSSFCTGSAEALQAKKSSPESSTENMNSCHHFSQTMKCQRRIHNLFSYISSSSDRNHYKGNKNSQPTYITIVLIQKAYESQLGPIHGNAFAKHCFFYLLLYPAASVRFTMSHSPPTAKSKCPCLYTFLIFLPNMTAFSAVTRDAQSSLQDSSRIPHCLSVPSQLRAKLSGTHSSKFRTSWVPTLDSDSHQPQISLDLRCGHAFAAELESAVRVP